MWKVILLIVSMPFTLAAQNIDSQYNYKREKGVLFEHNLSWKEILEKAKKEGKYIFVHCFATWCAPCKAMDKNVYVNAGVGEVLNNKFISVKMQMDSTEIDNEQVRRSYSDASTIMQRYKIESFPTFLFFSPDGLLVHKSSGYRDPNIFIEQVRFAADPKRIEFFAQLKAYKNGRKNYSSFPDLIKTTAYLLGDKELSTRIAKDYKEDYLDKLSIEQLCTKYYLDFIIENFKLVNSSDKFFFLFYRRSDRVDSILNNPGVSSRLVKYIVESEEVWGKLLKNDKPIRKKPNWNGIYESITNKYSVKLADAILPSAKIKYYRLINDWESYTILFEKSMKTDVPKREEGITGWPWKLNSAAWDLFLNCNEKKYLNKALLWSELSIKLEQPNPNIQFLDTRANLLYKLGRVKDAIAQEEDAIKTDNLRAQAKGRKKGGFSDDYSSIVEKMKRGEPTWPVK